MLLKNQLIMTIGETPNGWTLTREMVENSLDSFANKPIVWNKKQEFKDYRNMEDYKSCQVIGIISSEPNIQIGIDEVYVDIVIKDEYADLWKGKFDNWCMQIDFDKKSFILDSIEVF